MKYPQGYGTDMDRQHFLWSGGAVFHRSGVCKTERTDSDGHGRTERRMSGEEDAAWGYDRCSRS